MKNKKLIYFLVGAIFTLLIFGIGFILNFTRTNAQSFQGNLNKGPNATEESYLLHTSSDTLEVKPAPLTDTAKQLEANIDKPVIVEGYRPKKDKSNVSLYATEVTPDSTATPTPMSGVTVTPMSDSGNTATSNSIPFIESITPNSGPFTTKVIISGRNFTGKMALNWDNLRNVSRIESQTESQLIWTVPATPCPIDSFCKQVLQKMGEHILWVSNEKGESNKVTFTVTPYPN